MTCSGTPGRRWWGTSLQHRRDADELLGYLTLPGFALAIVGRRRMAPPAAAAAVLAVWARAVLISVALLPLTANPATSRRRSCRSQASWRSVGSPPGTPWSPAAAAPRSRAASPPPAPIALLPALLFNASVLANPADASYPGLDEHQYVTQQSALTLIGPLASAIERAGGPYPVRVDVGPYPRRDDVGPWGLDLRLNGTTTGAARRFLVFAHGTPAQRESARWLISDGARSDAAPRPGFRLVLRLPRATAAPWCGSTSGSRSRRGCRPAAERQRAQPAAAGAGHERPLGPARHPRELEPVVQRVAVGEPARVDAHEAGAPSSARALACEKSCRCSMSMIGERRPSARLSGARRSWQTSMSAPPGASRSCASRHNCAGSGTCSIVMQQVIRS